MSKKDLRVSIDKDTADAVSAIAKARRMTPAAVVEEALKAFLDPASVLNQAADLAAKTHARTVAVEDQLRVIADYIADATKAQASDDAEGFGL